MKNTFKENVSSIGVSYSKVIGFVTLINILLLLATGIIYFFYRKILVLIFGVAIDLIFDFVTITYFSSLKDKQEKDRENEFISLISYFQIFICNNMNVYTAFSSLIPFCSIWMKTSIEKMLRQIDEDKTVKPFVDFSNEFKPKVIQSVMLSIYQMIEEGENAFQINQFTVLFDNLNRERIKGMIMSKQRSLNNMNALPLFGAGFITVILTFSILLLMGDMINGF